MLNIIKYILLLFLISLTVDLRAQDEYAIKASIKFNADACGTCNERWLKEAFVSTSYLHGNGTILATFNYFPGENQWQQKYFKINSLKDIYVHYKDPVHDNWNYFTIKLSTTTIFKDEQRHNNSGISWHTTWIYVEVETIDPINLLSISPDDQSSAETYCLEDESVVLNLQLSAQNTTAYRTLYLKGYLDNQEIISEYLGSYSTSKTVTLSKNYLDKIWAKEVKFLVRSTHSSNIYIFGSPKNILFFPRIPPIEAKFIRTACSEKIEIILPPGYGQKHSNYKFKIGQDDNNSSNYFQLFNPLVEGDRLTFPYSRAVPDQTEFIIQVSSVYILEDNHECARNISLNSGEKPIPLSITPTLNFYTFLNVDYHISKNGANDGSANLNLNEGSRLKEYNWKINTGSWHSIPTSNLFDVDINNKKLKGLYPNTTYSITAQDTNGCFSDTISISNLKEPDIFKLKEKNSTFVKCHMENEGVHNDGVLLLEWSGGIGPYTLKISDEQKNSSSIDNITAYEDYFYNLKAGTYQISIEDRFSNFINATHTIQSNPKIDLAVEPQHVKCHGEKTGRIKVTTFNSNDRLITFNTTNFQHDTSNEIYEFTGLAADNYTVKVTVEGCSQSISNIAINQPNPLLIDAVTQKVKKYGDATGAIEATISGGVTPYKYIFYNSNLEKIDSGYTDNIANLSNLLAGNYSLVVTYNEICNVSKEAIKIEQPLAPLKINVISKDVDCYGISTGSVTISASGGWGGYTYGIDGVEITTNQVSGLSASPSQRIVFVRDKEGITKDTAIVIQEPTELLVNVKNVSDLQCYEDQSGSIEFDISGGISPYSISKDGSTWSDESGFSNLSANPNYAFYIKDKNKCLKTINHSINQPEKITLSIESVVSAYCNQNNGKITIKPSGGNVQNDFSYSWLYMDSSKVVSNNSNVFDNIYSGRYRATVTDDNNCTKEIEATVSDIDGPSIEKYSVDSVSCNSKSDGSIEILSVNGGVPEYSYFINGNKTTTSIEGLPSGSYHIRVMDQKNCKFDKFIFVPQPDPITIHEQLLSSPTCHNTSDGSIEVTFSGGNKNYQPLWSNGKTSNKLEALSAGVYNLSVTDYKSCTAEKSFTLVSPSMPSPNWLDNSAVICTGNTLVLDGGDFLNYKWSNNNQSFSENRLVNISESGEYILEITDFKGCVGLDTFNLEVSDHPLDAIFLMSDSALVNDMVSAIDVTWPIPDSIDWFFSKPVQFTNENNWSSKFSWNEEEDIKVTLRAWYGGCFSDTSKVVVIYSGHENARLALSNEPLILGFLAYPNPSDGRFNVKLKFSQSSDASLELIDNSQYSTIQTVTFKNISEMDEEFNFANKINPPPGIYYLRLRAGKERQVIRILIR